jgi:hypothetical protein
VDLRTSNSQPQLGISVAPGKGDLSTHCFVSSVLPGSAAAADARVKPGDEILEVDGRPVRGKGEQACVAALLASTQAARRTKLLLLRHPRALEALSSTGSPSSSYTSEFSPPSLAVAPLPPPGSRVVAIHRDAPTQGLGIMITSKAHPEFGPGVFISGRFPIFFLSSSFELTVSISRGKQAKL